MTSPAQDRAPTSRRARTAVVQLLAFALAAVVVTVGVAATSGTSSTKLTTINVTARDTGFTLSKKTAPVGQVRYVVTNRGSKPHGFQISGKKTATLAKGKTARLTVTFKKAGKFAYSSTVKADTARGFKGTFTLTAASPGNAAAGKSLFVANCGTCHVLKAASTRGSIGPSLDLKAHPYAPTLAIVTNGKPGTAMPGFKGQLTAKQIQDISAFVAASTS
jgi:mono/diheme cytochrome c family protein